MAKIRFTAIVFLLVIQSVFASNSPDAAPAPPPESGDSLTPDLAPGSPASSPLAASPPSPVAPSPSDLAPKASASDSPSPSSSPSPAPAPAPAPTGPSDINDNNLSDTEDDSSSGGGMSGGKKIGIAVGVVAAACIVGLAGFVYKKRQENIRRSRYSYSARNEIL